MTQPIFKLIRKGVATLTIEEDIFELTDKEAENLLVQLWNAYANKEGYKGTNMALNQHYYLGGIEDIERLGEPEPTPADEVIHKEEQELPKPPETRDAHSLLIWFADLAQVDKESVNILLHKMNDPSITTRELEDKVGKGRTVISERIVYMAKCHAGLARILGHQTQRSRAQRRRRKVENKSRKQPTKRKASKRLTEPFKDDE